MIESYEARRRVELREVIRGLDVKMAALVEEARASRESSGFSWYQELPSPIRNPEVSNLEDRRSLLVRRRNAALAENASLS